MLLLWTAAVLWTTLLNRIPGKVGDFQTIPLHSYREMKQTGNREILRSSFMNAALFYPAGLLLTAALPRRKKIPVTLVVMAAFSLAIEVLQHKHWGRRNSRSDRCPPGTAPPGAAPAEAFHKCCNGSA